MVNFKNVIRSTTRLIPRFGVWRYFTGQNLSHRPPRLVRAPYPNVTNIIVSYRSQPEYTTDDTLILKNTYLSPKI